MFTGHSIGFGVMIACIVLTLGLTLGCGNVGGRGGAPSDPGVEDPVPTVLGALADGNCLLVREDGQLLHYDPKGTEIGRLQLEVTAEEGCALGLVLWNEKVVVVETAWDGQRFGMSPALTIGAAGEVIAVVVPDLDLSGNQPLLHYSLGALPVEEYRIEAITGHASAAFEKNTGEPLHYLLRLDGFFDGEPKHEVTFDGDLILALFADGSARITGEVFANSFNGDFLPAEWLADGRAGPFDVWVDFDPVVHDGKYDYYGIVPRGGELIHVGDPLDRVNLVTYPFSATKPFQIGFGANGKNDHFGASGWVNYSHFSDGGVVGCAAVHWVASDFLMDLVPLEATEE